jgi:hypothetical protein
MVRSTRIHLLTPIALGFLVAALLLASSPARAATDDINTSRPHLVLGESYGRATITWDTSTPITEVWASVNGQPRQLFARSGTPGRHSREATRIVHGYTVFALHKGSPGGANPDGPTGRLLDYTSVTTQRPPASTFGFNYWPAGENSASTLGPRWPLLQATVARDLDQIASIGGRVIRIALTPKGNHSTGDQGAWRISAGPGGDLVKPHVLRTQVGNLIRLIKLCRERGLKVIVGFNNNFLRRIPNVEPIQYQWEPAYPPEDGGWQGFVSHALAWLNPYVTAIEWNSDPTVRSTVIAYDYQNEMGPTRNVQVYPYLTYLYDNSTIPPGKRAVSVLSVANDVSALKSALGSRHLDYVDFHSFPEGNNPQVQTAYRTLVGAFRDSTVFLGEFGHATPGSCIAPSPDEQSGIQTLASTIGQARSNVIPYFLHWMLWDNAPPQPRQIRGLGYEPHCPKDALGGMLRLTSRLNNPDMEELVSGRPVDWRAGGKGSRPTFAATLSARGSAEDVAATNRRYARVRVQSPPGFAWLRSRPIPVNGGDRLSVNAYVRSNMKAVAVGVTQIRADRSVVRTKGPSFNPVGSSWNNWLHRTGPWGVCLDPRATEVIVTVRGYAGVLDPLPAGSPYYLDVDAVSAATVPRPPSCG